MQLQKLHHVAYRCANAAETVEFYTKILGLPLAHALTNDYVPSVKEYSPHIHIFFQMADGSFIAFFEVPKSPAQQKDPNTPEWVQHLALEVEDEAALLEGKRRLDEAKIPCVGPTDHGFCKSIYFFDPSGHRLELTIRTETPGVAEKQLAGAADVVKAWQARGVAENWPVRTRQAA
jgi:catechol 2,3-dioxygenase-like lactoylglutathione lyase family enzyme